MSARKYFVGNLLHLMWEFCWVLHFGPGWLGSCGVVESAVAKDTTFFFAFLENKSVLAAGLRKAQFGLARAGFLYAARIKVQS